MVDAYRFPIEQLGFTLDARGRRGPAGAGARPRGAVAGAHQPAQQRDQVQPGARRRSRSRVRRERDRVLLSVRRPRASASRSAEHRGSSRSSTGWRPAWCTPPRAAGSASPSCSTSPRPTGDAWSSTSAPGEGSTFTLSLPVPAEAAAGRARASAPGYDGAPRGRRAAMSKILIVEDEPDMVARTEGQLRVRGLRGHDRERRAVGAGAGALAEARPDRPRRHAAEAVRARGVQDAARRGLRGPDPDADGARPGDRQGGGPRARGGRLRDQAVLDPRAAGARAGGAAAHRRQGQAARALLASPTSSSTSRPTRPRRTARRSSSARASSSCCAT